VTAGKPHDAPDELREGWVDWVVNVAALLFEHRPRRE